MTDAIQLLVGTRKGAWIFRSDADRRDWRVQGPIFLGAIVNHLMLDPRDGKTLLMAAATGHLGPTIFRSTDDGETRTEAGKPPAFPKTDDPRARSVDHSFWLEPGHASEPRRLVGGDLAAGAVREPGRRRDLGQRRRLQ